MILVTLTDKNNRNDVDIEISHVAPSASQFIQLRETIGWNNLDSLDEIEQSIQSSLFWITIVRGKELVACGRVIGDGYMYFYLQDIIVHPKCQGLGFGQMVMNGIEQWLLTKAKKGATIGLLAAKGKEDFYARFEYLKRDGSALGLGMCKFI